MSDLKMFGPEIEAMVALYAASRGITVTAGSAVTFAEELDTPERKGRGFYVELRDVEFGVTPPSPPPDDVEEDDDPVPPAVVTSVPARKAKRGKAAVAPPPAPGGPRKVIVPDAARTAPGSLEDTETMTIDAARLAAGPPPPSDGKPVLPSQIRRFRPGGAERGATVEERFRVEAVDGLVSDTGRVEPGGPMRELAPDP